jgi:hypothetical protein
MLKGTFMSKENVDVQLVTATIDLTTPRQCYALPPLHRRGILIVPLTIGVVSCFNYFPLYSLQTLWIKGGWGLRSINSSLPATLHRLQ